MSTLKRRILVGMGANAFGQAISILTQLAALPLFLTRWDISQYGIWLMLSAIPSYFSMADAGIVNAARNEMTMAVGRGDHEHANRVFQSALAFLLTVSLSTLLVSGAVLYLTPVAQFGASNYAATLLVLLTGILLSFFNGLAEAAFCAVGLYGFGTALGHVIRFAEWLGGLIGLLCFGSFFSVALGMLLCRVLGVLLAIVLAKRMARALHWGFGHAQWQQFKATVKPALFFLIFPLASALSIQGFTLLIGAVLGAASVAIFNTYRTLARVIVQATSILSFSVGPELSRLFGAQQHRAYHALFRRSQLISAALALLASVIVAALGAWILQFWTHGRVQYVPALLWSMLLYATVVGLCHVPKVLLMSINRHGSIALASALVYAASLVLAYLFGAALNLIGIILVMSGAELVLLLLTIYLAESEIRRSQPVSAAVA